MRASVIIVLLAAASFAGNAAAQKRAASAPDWKARLASARSAAESWSPRSLPVLIRAMTDESMRVRRVSTRLLETAMRGRQATDREVLEMVAAELRTTTRPDGLLSVLSRIGSPEAFGIVLWAVRDGHDAIRPQAVRSLNRWKLPDASAAARAALDDQSAIVRRDACIVIGQKRDREAVPRLIELLDDADRGVAAAAHHVLVHMTGQRHGRDRALWELWREKKEEAPDEEGESKRRRPRLIRWSPSRGASPVWRLGEVARSWQATCFEALLSLADDIAEEVGR